MKEKGRRLRQVDYSKNKNKKNKEHEYFKRIYDFNRRGKKKMQKIFKKERLKQC